MSESEKRDYRQELTSNIMKMVEAGTAPWQKPWNADAAAAHLAMPYNAASGRAYRGGNSIWLMAKAMEKAEFDPRFVTYNQAKDNDWQVKKGERGTSVEYWQFDKEEKRKDPTTGKDETVRIKLDNPRVFYATVFHASQIDGIPKYEPRVPENGWKPVEQAENIMAGSKAKIIHDQVDRAYYAPSSDSVHLPPKEAFPRDVDYYEVAMHELAHWSGHESRLNRDLTGSFGSESYAKEELRAQMASLYLSAETGVPFNPDRHASYQNSWLQVLQNDKNEFFRAAKDAEVIADYILDLQKEKVIEKQTDQVKQNLDKASELLKNHPAMANPAVMELVLNKIGQRLQEPANEKPKPQVMEFDR
ncbi:MAG TPA: zincin-like metallopeptidase domain-containing protein [Dyadobacter sp.]|jgi:antirestriction protein ArdC|nr:zincin-like metallopeptidase domain-containing protein [Dyadobacter sp.]